MPSLAMQKKLVFATNNVHKLQEVRQILGNDREILSLSDIGCHEEIPETASTLEGNARQKAQWIADRYGVDCFADDTGLEVEALHGAPGVMSARYAASNGRGEGHDASANSRLLLEQMEGVENRTARFRTVIYLILNGEEHIVDGVVNGSITTAPRGTDGFGYDPIFLPTGCDKTFAQMTAEEKNSISHRRNATDALMRLLESLP